MRDFKNHSTIARTLTTYGIGRVVLDWSIRSGTRVRVWEEHSVTEAAVVNDHHLCDGEAEDTAHGVGIGYCQESHQSKHVPLGQPSCKNRTSLSRILFTIAHTKYDSMYSGVNHVGNKVSLTH